MAHPYLHNGDARMRLDNTVCMYKKKPVYVQVTDDCAENHVKVKYIGGVNKTYEIDYTTNEFCYKSIPLGYMQYGKNAIYLSRCPLRKQRQGLNVRSLRVNGQRRNEYKHQDILTSKSFRNSVLGEYPTLKEAITMLRDQEYGSVALHRFVAIQEGDGIVMPITYRMRIVGMYDTRQGVMVMVPGPEASIMERIFATLNLEM